VRFSRIRLFSVAHVESSSRPQYEAQFCCHHFNLLLCVRDDVSLILAQQSSSLPHVHGFPMLRVL